MSSPARRITASMRCTCSQSLLRPTARSNGIARRLPPRRPQQTPEHAAGSASLLHNLGWTMHERGEYAAALDYWRNALAVREAAHDVARTRIARWTVARGLRSLGRLDEAEAAQRALVDELQAANAPDGYVFEELAEIALARGDRAAAQPWAEKALAILGEDADLHANDAARLARLAEVARPLPPATR